MVPVKLGFEPTGAPMNASQRRRTTAPPISQFTSGAEDGENAHVTLGVRGQALQIREASSIGHVDACAVPPSLYWQFNATSA
ncbi:Hypothetical protein SMAX5B_019355 [Scophthalmus maximus]|uniref:Uncharacterized protein n=1 Tax=Scophthalmus maximus TaxID=52904 RepID=A0A2U9BW81_SCOMX|nr:Hypothetical protein SMAX5B_019355 [Scophthalmus maximus]